MTNEKLVLKFATPDSNVHCVQLFSTHINKWALPVDTINKNHSPIAADEAALFYPMAAIKN
jgi:hypothetical protein